MVGRARPALLDGCNARRVYASAGDPDRTTPPRRAAKSALIVDAVVAFLDSLSADVLAAGAVGNPGTGAGPR